MIKMFYDADSEEICIKCFGSEDDPQLFTDEKESCQFVRMSYDPKHYLWRAPVGKLNSIMEEMKRYEIELSEYDKMLINKKIDSMDELKQNLSRKERKVFIPTLMRYPPI